MIRVFVRTFAVIGLGFVLLGVGTQAFARPELEDQDKAVDALIKKLQANPKDERVARALKIVMERGSLENAIRAGDALKRLRPDVPNTVNMLRLSFLFDEASGESYDLERRMNAARDLTRMLERDPGDTRISVILNALMWRGNKKEVHDFLTTELKRLKPEVLNWQPQREIDRLLKQALSEDPQAIETLTKLFKQEPRDFRLIGALVDLDRKGGPKGKQAAYATLTSVVKDYATVAYDDFEKLIQTAVGGQLWSSRSFWEFQFILYGAESKITPENPVSWERRPHSGEIRVRRPDPDVKNCYYPGIMKFGDFVKNREQRNGPFKVRRSRMQRDPEEMRRQPGILVPTRLHIPGRQN